MTNADWWAKVRAQRDAANDALQRPERVGQISAPWTLWTLSKNGNEATATARAIHAVGLELRFSWNGDLRASQVYRDLEPLKEQSETVASPKVERSL
jgi:hypothetical protein